MTCCGRLFHLHDRATGNDLSIARGHKESSMDDDDAKHIIIQKTDVEFT